MFHSSITAAGPYDRTNATWLDGPLLQLDLSTRDPGQDLPSSRTKSPHRFLLIAVLAALSWLPLVGLALALR